MSWKLPTSSRLQAVLPSARHTLVVSVFALALSWLLHVLTRTPFPIVISRVGFVAGALLLAYSAAGTLRPRWLAEDTARLLAVGLMAPLAALASAFMAKGMDALSYLSNTQTLIGHVLMVLLAWMFGLPFALVALRGMRKAQEAAARLQADLERDRLERELLDARLRLLQAQIEPHFLFNTLANIEALVAAGSDQAGPVLRHLIAYLRAAMPRLQDADASLADEMDLVRAYLELMRLRMPDRLQFSLTVPPSLSGVRFPPMALLTLVENAIRHGIDPSVDGGVIEVGGQHDAASGAALLWVQDTGVGMAPTAHPGTGLANVRARLHAYFGASARIDLHEAVPQGVRVELHFSTGGPA
ncbi:sensor histidine kinase [Massilia sp. TS11]|uniref:sensor histidine kinase n=1 Tax=Massilia sp. TS11 TaxID=2908003 RepID=UPI001EDAB0B3|nr:histidine kinase [Massilia sp. TS11]MCG2584767.1 histidine kinase [Massilia sp. TS11]